MTASAHSQSLFPVKTQYKGYDAIMISVAQMDTISVKLLRFKVLQSKFDALLINNEALAINNQKTFLELGFYKKSNADLGLINKELTKQLNIKDAIYNNDKQLWELKAKGKFKYFLYGTALGGIIVALLTIL